MNDSHSIEIDDHLWEAWDFGFTRIPFRKLYRWYDADRITKRVWADLEERWEKVRKRDGDEEGWRLGRVDNNRADDLTLICLDPEDCKTSWFKPL